MPISDYDKRITILTKERGKMTAFARGSRRQNSQLLAAANPFSFGEFELYEGRNSYQVGKATIHNYFRELTADVEAAYMGFYFLEFAEYVCQENNDETEMLKLLYQSFRALESKKFPKKLIRAIFELKAMSLNGEAPNVFSCMKCQSKQDIFYFSVKQSGVFCEKCGNQKGSVCIHTSTRYAMQYVIASPVPKLFTFQLSEPVLEEFQEIVNAYLRYHMVHEFKSLEILETL